MQTQSSGDAAGLMNSDILRTPSASRIGEVDAEAGRLPASSDRTNTNIPPGSRGDDAPAGDDSWPPSPSAQVYGQPATLDLQVQVPPGAVSGSTLQVQAPNGQLLEVVVPPGLMPGQMMIVRVPAAGPSQQSFGGGVNQESDHEFEMPEIPDWLKDGMWARRRRLLPAGCVFFLFFTTFIMFLCSFKTVGPYHYGMLKNGVTHRVDMDTGVYNPGVYLVGFWYHFVLFPKTLQTIQFSFDSPESGVQHIEPLHLRSKDKVGLHVEVSVQYLRIKDELVPFFKKAMSSQVQENFIVSGLRAELIKTMFSYNAADCWENRRGLRDAFFEACKVAFAKTHVMCWDLQLYRSHMHASYEGALIETQLQKQQKLIEGAKKRAAEVRAITSVELADYERNITVLEADARAERYNIAGVAKSTAAAVQLDAQAVALQNLRSNLTLPNGSTMTDLQLTKYERRLMIGTSLEKPHFYYGIDGKGPSFMTMQKQRRLVDVNGLSSSERMSVEL